MLTGSNSNFRSNSNGRLLSMGSCGSPCSTNLNSCVSTSYFPSMYLDAVVNMELVDIP